jgi:ComF family protein
MKRIKSFLKNIPWFAAYIREYLFPAGCPICGTELLEVDEAWYGLCRPCMANFALGGERRCAGCGRPLISEQGRCLQCREGEDPGPEGNLGSREPGSHGFDGAFSVFPYTGKYRKLLGAYKFGKNLALGNFLAEKIVEALGKLPLISGEAVLVPVPPRPGKTRRTGWDQITYLGKLLQKTLTLYPCLKRLPSKSQKELNRANRKTNLRGKIICTKPVPAELILFDDVITTGATLDACTAALKEAGAKTVWAISLFYD